MHLRRHWKRGWNKIWYFSLSWLMKDELGEKKMIKYAGLGVKTIENNDGSWSKIRLHLGENI